MRRASRPNLSSGERRRGIVRQEGQEYGPGWINEGCHTGLARNDLGKGAMTKCRGL